MRHPQLPFAFLARRTDTDKQRTEFGTLRANSVEIINASCTVASISRKWIIFVRSSICVKVQLLINGYIADTGFSSH